VRLGSGWYPIEHYRNITFRWARNDAEVTACPDPNNRTLAMLLEPGPSTGTKVLTLRIRGNQGDSEIATVKPGQYVKITVNSKASAETFALSTDSRNIAVPHDKRILNFRALAIILGSAAGNCKNEVVFDGSPLALGANWGTYETFKGESFRWVVNNAQVKLRGAQPRPYTLEAEVEPGPSLGGAPLVISVRDSRGKTLAQSTAVKARSYVAFRLPAEPSGTMLTLVVNSKNAKVPNDKRILNFRVFGLKIKP
jgi:RNase P/RNase MRP subunit p29